MGHSLCLGRTAGGDAQGPPLTGLISSGSYRGFSCSSSLTNTGCLPLSSLGQHPPFFMENDAGFRTEEEAPADSLTSFGGQQERSRHPPLRPFKISHPGGPQAPRVPLPPQIVCHVPHRPGPTAPKPRLRGGKALGLMAAAL